MESDKLGNGIFFIRLCQESSCEEQWARDLVLCGRHQKQIFAGKADLKITLLVKTPLHEFVTGVRSGSWADFIF